jgi:phosphoglycolate phosphatase
MKKRLILFDLDWTLIYSGGAGVRALDRAFEKRHRIPHAMQKVTVDGKTDPAICREMIEVLLGRPAATDEVAALCQDYLRELAIEVPAATGYRVLPGVPELLEALHREPAVLIGLGTGNLIRGAEIKLARADLMKYFAFGGFGSDAEERADVLRTGVRRGEELAGAAFPARDVWIIGDHLRDVKAGKAIGATTLAVASGPMSYEALAETTPDYLLRDLSDTSAALNLLVP